MSVLGSLILDNNSIAEVLPVLTAESFYSNANAEIYRILVERFEARQNTDDVILKDVLTTRGLLAEVGGVEYIMNLMTIVPSAANAQEYAEIVRQKGALRRLLSIATQIEADVYESSVPPQTILERAETALLELATRRPTGHLSLNEALHEAFARMDRAAARRGQLLGLSSGFYDLDDITCGLQQSQLVILAARPAVGKTTLALNISAHVASRGCPVAFFSFEMDGAQLTTNVLACEARVSARLLRRGILDAPGNESKLTVATKISGWPIYFHESGGNTVVQVRNLARQIVLQKQVGLVVVDYLQLVAPIERRGRTRESEVAEVSRGLKAVAQELHIPVLAVSQLNRAPEGRRDHRPRLIDLRESGAIEQDADVVLLLHRESMYSMEDKHEGKATVIVAKNRNGPCETLELGCDLSQFRFFNLATAAQTGG